jgi:PAS domain S-box-containing protein
MFAGDLMVSLDRREWERVFDAIPAPTLLLDSEGRVQRANRAAIETLQKPLTEVMGRPCHEVLHGQDQACILCPHAEALACGQLRRGDIFNAQENRIFDAACIPLRNSGGKLLGIIVSLRDVTAWRRNEEALRNSEEQYRLMFEGNPHPMWVFDRQTLAFLAVNDAAVAHYGYSREDFLRMTLKDIRPPEDVPLLLNYMAQSQAGIRTAGEWRHRRKDGTILNILVTTHPLAFEGKEAMLVLAEDVTERKRLEQELIQAKKMEGIGRLAAGIAHDFNNLLTVVEGRSALLRDQLEAGSPLRHSVDEVLKAAERAAELTRQLLAFSRQQVLQPRVVNLNSIVMEMGKLLRSLIGENIELVTRCAKDLGRIKADPSQLGQIIMNLAVNARDAMSTGGRLTIETANAHLDSAYAETRYQLTPGPYVLLAVSDNGMGMDEKTRSRVFEPFFTTKVQGKGTGLGLATVYGIVKQSGGYIWVYSEPGKGTTFKAYFPRIAEPMPSAATPMNPARALRRGTETILVAEDEASLRAMIVDILQSCGYEVLEAPDGLSALKTAEGSRQPIHLLLTDLVMPGLGGRELADRLSAVHPKLKTLYISGYTDDVAFRHGAFGVRAAFLQKPFSPEGLSHKVRELLDAHLAP